MRIAQVSCVVYFLNAPISVSVLVLRPADLVVDGGNVCDSSEFIYSLFPPLKLLGRPSLNPLGEHSIVFAMMNKIMKSNCSAVSNYSTVV